MFLNTIQSPVAQRDGFTHWAPGLSLSSVGCRVTPLPSELILSLYSITTILRNTAYKPKYYIDDTTFICLCRKNNRASIYIIVILADDSFADLFKKYESLFIFAYKTSDTTDRLILKV